MFGVKDGENFESGCQEVDRKKNVLCKTLAIYQQEQQLRFIKRKYEPQMVRH